MSNVNFGESEDLSAMMSLRRAAADNPGRTAVIEGENRYSYADLLRLVARRMSSIERPQPGRPAFLVPKTDLKGLVDILAHWESGIPAALISPKLTTAEREALIAHSNAITEPLPPEAAFVVFTSGTTGIPKPAVLTRQSLSAGALAMAKALEMTSGDVFQLSLSPARVGGLGIVMRTLAMRSTIALSPGFSGLNFPKTLERDGVTLASLVPAMLADVLEKNPGWHHPKGLRAILIGGAHYPDNLRAEAARRGIPTVTTYGMTETGSTSAVSAYENRYSAKPDGEVPLDGTSFKVINGSLVLKGPMLFKGYWGRPDAVMDGWFDTGDAGVVHPDGTVKVIGRNSEMIITAGEKVIPAEVEAVLETLPGIREALVVGMPHQKWGQVVTALLVGDASPRPEGDAIVQGLSTRLARWKSPRRIAWVDSLPLTSAGKRKRRPEVLKGLAFDVLHYASKA